MKVTKREIEYAPTPYGIIARIPKNVPVIPAKNLPGKQKYWVQPWFGMTHEEESWQRNYGFLLMEDEVHDA